MIDEPLSSSSLSEQPPEQSRALVIGLGEIGGAIVSEVRRRLADRWRQRDVAGITCLAVTDPADTTIEGNVIAELARMASLAPSGWRRSAEAMLDKGELLDGEAKLDARAMLDAVSMLDPGAMRKSGAGAVPGGYGHDARWHAPEGDAGLPSVARAMALDAVSPQAIPVWIVAAAADPDWGTRIAGLATRIHDLARQRVGVAAHTAGVLLLPDGAARDDDFDAALQRSSATLAAIAGGSDGTTAPPFDAGCRVIGATDATGWRFPDERHRWAYSAEVVVLHVTSRCDVAALAVDTVAADLDMAGERPFVAVGWAAASPPRARSHGRLAFAQPTDTAAAPVAALLRSLYAAATPFLTWDPTRTGPTPPSSSTVLFTAHGRAALPPGDGRAPPAPDDDLDVAPWAAVIANGDDTRITVLTEIHGLPLAAIVPPRTPSCLAATAPQGCPPPQAGEDILGADGWNSAGEDEPPHASTGESDALAITL